MVRRIRNEITGHTATVIEALCAAADAYNEMACEAAVRGDIYAVHRYVSRSRAHRAEATHVERYMS